MIEPSLPAAREALKINVEYFDYECASGHFIKASEAAAFAKAVMHTILLMHKAKDGKAFCEASDVFEELNKTIGEWERLE